MLKVFSASWCQACKQVKKFLAQNSIEFQEIDIDTDKNAHALLKKLNLSSIPITYLDDNNYVVGMDSVKILELAKK